MPPEPFSAASSVTPVPSTLEPGMVTLPVVESPAAAPHDCWNRIGVKGDKSCPELFQHIHCRNCPVFTAAGRRLFDREPPAAWYEEWTEQLARPERLAAVNTAPVLIFRLGEEWFALHCNCLVEIADMRPIHSVPQRNQGLLLGLVNIRGELQLCMSLAKLLHIDPQEQAGRPRLIVAEADGERWAFPADEVTGVFRIDLDEVTNVPATIRRGSVSFSRGVIAREGKHIDYLRGEVILDALKRSLS